MVLTQNNINSKMDQRTGTKRERDRVEIIQQQQADETPVGKRPRNSNENNYPTIQLAGPLRYQDQQVS